MPPLEIATEAEHAAALAAALESAAETTLDPTDCRLAAKPFAITRRFWTA